MNRLLAYSPNLKQSWMLLVIYIACLIPSHFASLIIRHTGAATTEWAELWGTILSFAFLVLIVVRLGKNDNYISTATLNPSPVIWFLLALFTVLINQAMTPLIAWIPKPDLIKRIMTEASQNNLTTFLGIVIIAPVCEEWLCRGIILKGLLTRYSPLKSILWSTIIFSVLHINPSQVVSAFFFGLAFGWIYWRTRALWHCIFMHTVNNAFVFLLMILFPDFPGNVTIADVTGINYIYIYTAVLFTGVLSWIGIKRIISSDTKRIKEL